MRRSFIFAAVSSVMFGGISLNAADEGWYITRKSPYDSIKHLEQRDTNIRDLITDCIERSISLSCHRAGVWFLDHNDTANGEAYLDASCTLGRGYSCRLMGDRYSKKAEEVAKQIKLGEEEVVAIKKFRKVAWQYYKNGCLKYDRRSCTRHPKRVFYIKED